MKLLKEFSELSDAEALAERLRNKGILIHISSVNSHQLSHAASGAINVGVWAVANDQAEDAVALLSNNQHQVSNPVSQEDMKLLEANTKKQFSASSNAFTIKVILGITFVIALMSIFYSGK